MKTLLQLNLQSQFNKNYYRIRKNKLVLTKDNPHSQYTFDNICYSSLDCNSSIIYDIVVDYSQKNKIMANTQSTCTININDHDIDNKNGNMINLSTKLIQDTYIEPQLNYTVIFDQITENQSIQALIKEVSHTQIFKKQNIKIGHFLTHDSGIFDFHKKRVYLSDTERQQLDKQYQKSHGSIQDNFMWIYNKQINLCEQIKSNNTAHIAKSLTYITAQQFNKLTHPILGVQLASNMTKAEQIQHKQLQNKKVMQVFVVNIGTKLRITLILFNYNKNYAFSQQQQKQLSQLLMMHGVVVGDIKYQNIKIEIINKLAKNSQKLYYAMYFPGPRLIGCLTQSSNLVNASGINRTKNQQLTITSINGGNMITRQKSSVQSKSDYFANSSQLKSSKASHFSRKKLSPQKTLPKPNDFVGCIFNNYIALNTKDKDSLQKIIKQYLVKKEDSLKIDLQKIKQRVKQLKSSQRIEQSNVSELKIKCTKALQKISQSIIQLRKMGINNVQRHMDWLKFCVQQKKQYIKQTQQQIEQINKKTIENRRSHEYFHEKMKQFKDKLKTKQQYLSKLNQNDPFLTELHNQQKQNSQSLHKNYLSQLSLVQLQQLQQHKQKLKTRLVQKLKNSSQKKLFFQSLNQIRGKVSKLQLTRLEQKYFDLLHN